MQDPHSKIELIKYRGRETATHLLTVDDLIVYRTADGGAVIEFIRYGTGKSDSNKPVETYRLTVCPEDAQRLRS